MDGNQVNKKLNDKQMKASLFLVVNTIILMLIAFGCNDVADVNRPIGNSAIPKQVTVDSVRNFNGGSTIFYSLPDDKNLKYIRVVYEPYPGQMVDSKASFYVDSIRLEGFPKDGEYAVNIYSVSYGETSSEPIKINVNPLTPPFLAVKESILSSASFGGIKVSFTNPETASLAVGIAKKTPENTWEQIYMYYTKAPSATFALRGQESVETQYAIYVRDRWGNISDSLFMTCTPWQEMECDKVLFRVYSLPTDDPGNHTWGGTSTSNGISKTWDGKLTAVPLFHTKNNTFPIHFTFDMGMKYNLSRFIYYPRNDNGKTPIVFLNGHPHLFDVWGSNAPNPNGSFDATWTKLGSFESKKASGTGPEIPATAEDIALAGKGEEYEFPAGIPAVRYIRYRVFETWGNYGSWGEYTTSGFTMVQELTFFGIPEN